MPLWLLVLYGLGTTIGAGIYALLGKVAGSAGLYAPWAFLFASLMAAFTALSFAELSSRFPKSAGEALYVREGLGLPWLATLVGLLVVAVGCVSSAAIVCAFYGYQSEFVTLPRGISLVAVVAVLGALVAWGIVESTLFAGLLTLLEIGGILLVIFAARGSFALVPDQLAALTPPADPAVWHGMLAAALLAFYAFLGFEDMVNVAEEVKDATRNLPVAIVLTLVVTTLLYFLLSLAAVLSVEPARLAASEAPLALVFEVGSGRSSAVISTIALLAIVNGALIQMIMASRVLYGLSRQGSLPGRLGKIHPVTRTPLYATGLVVLTVALLAVWFPIGTLAKATSIITLVIFSLINLSLCGIKLKARAPHAGWRTPFWVPATGFLVSTLFALSAFI